MHFAALPWSEAKRNTDRIGDVSGIKSFHPRRYLSFLTGRIAAAVRRRKGIHMRYQYAKRTEKLPTSRIRDLMQLTFDPSFSSLCGGNPDPQCFPSEDLIKATERVLTREADKALQYNSTEGHPPLRQWIADRLNRQNGTKYALENIQIVSGSQQGLDFIGKALLNEGDVVICEKPTYMAALNAFRPCGAQFCPVTIDDEGMVLEELEEALKTTENVKFIYVIPTFHNPTGITWSMERRQGLVELAKKYEIPIVEDNPYGDLRYSGEAKPGISALDPETICLGTFSKIVSPGVRTGWVAGPADFVKKISRIKQASDLQSNTFVQYVLAEYLSTVDIDEKIAAACNIYREKRDTVLRVFDKEMPSCVEYTHPEGGFFLWVRLPEECNTEDLLKLCIELKTAFVPGDSFFAAGGGANCFRICFTQMSIPVIEKACHLMCVATERYLKELGRL